MYVGIRCLDGAAGQWLCRHLEAPTGTMHGASIGHSLWPDGRLRVDEVSICWKGKRPGTGLVKVGVSVGVYLHPNCFADCRLHVSSGIKLGTARL